MSTERWDVAVVGGGIVGLATAVEIAARDSGARRVLVLERESAVGLHQTGRNSGVVHSGLYYAPGSRKARLCVDGARRMAEFCRAHDLPFEVPGKLVVATRDAELGALEELERRGVANGVAGLEWLDADGLHEVEPHAAGVAALHVPGTAVTNFARVAAALVECGQANGVEVRTGCGVRSARHQDDGWSIATSQGTVSSRLLVVCAGLHADRVARSCGKRPRVRILPFRGEYYVLAPSARELVRGLIYPVPDPNLPFLGVHFTRRVDGTIEAGPNAVPALARDGYTWSRFDAGDVLDALTWPGSWRLALRHARAGVAEIHRSLSKGAFVRALQRLVPAVRVEHLERAPAGVRAQAVDATGRLLDDFELVEGEGSIFVLNAPSPAATASLAIASELADRLGA